MSARRERGAVAIAIGAGASLGLAAVVLAACSADTERVGFVGDGGRPEAAIPPTGDGASGIADAGLDPDARGPFNPADEAVECAVTPCATQLVAGSAHFCVRMSDGTARCWGEDAFGALGRGDGPSPEPADGGTTVRPVVDLGGVTQLSAAGAVTCARIDDGGVRCWGDNRHGQLGLAADPDPPIVDEDRHPTPSSVALAAAVRVDVGHGTVCAVLTTGKLACWGKDDQLQLARGDAGLDPLNPVRGPGLSGVEPLAFTRVAAGAHTILALDAEGDLWSWGALAGDEGLLSGRVASVSPEPIPRRIEQLSKVTSFAASASVAPPSEEPPPDEPGIPPPNDEEPPPRAHACAISNGEVYCWGRSHAGALCTGLPDREQRPARAPIIPTAWPQRIAVADEITCVRMTDGTIQCCGSDARGRLGTGTVGVLSPSFVEARAFTGHAVQVATSDRAVCVLSKDGSVECWGSNEKGELGMAPDDDAHPSPVKVVF